jgi:hypothetical protein
MSNPRWRTMAKLTIAVAALGYLGLLVITSLTSDERTLEPGARYAFCGFYLDCHLGVSVEQARTEPVRAGAGYRYVVQLRFDSDARRARLTLRNPTLMLMDVRGRRFLPVTNPANVTLNPGEVSRSELVFETPEPLQFPRLVVRQGPRLERLLETFLVGDADSILHQRVYLALD